MFEEERVAADLVAFDTGASVVPGPYSGVHDAELVLASGRTVGLEVTQAADRVEVETWAAISRNHQVAVPALHRWWQVGLRSGARVVDAASTLPGLLAGLEALGETEHRWLKNVYGTPAPDPLVRAIARELDAVGVDHAQSIPVSSPPGGLSIVVHKEGDWVDGEDLTAAVEAEAWKDDNRAKLAAMPTDEQHLFVWVDFSATAAHAALGLGVLTFPDPNLPPEVGTLWVAARHSEPGKNWLPGAAYRWSASGPWVAV